MTQPAMTPFSMSGSRGGRRVRRPPRPPSRRRHWAWVGITTVFLVIVGGGTLLALGYTLRPVHLVLLSACGAVALAVLLVSLGPAQLAVTSGAREDPWHVRHAVPYSVPGRDLRVVRDAQAISEELSGRRPSPDLHDRLRSLAEDRVRRAYPIGLADPGARELLGDRAHRLLTGPPRRLSPADLTHVIDRIEEL